MEIKKLPQALLFSGLLALSSPATVEAQHITNAQSRENIEQIVNNEYNIVTRRIEGRETIRDLSSELRTVNHDKIQWLLDTYNHPLSPGDIVRIVETQNERGIYYPAVVEVDYLDPNKKDKLFFGEPSTEILRHAFIIDYHDVNGDLRRRLWTNNNNHSLFDIVKYDFRFPLEGFIEDYRVTSPFGLRNNPVPDAGGPNENFHTGTDWAADVGTNLIAPIDGDFYGGYTRRNIFLSPAYNTDRSLGRIGILNTSRIIRNQRRNPQRVRLQFQFFHLENYKEEISDRMINEKLLERNPENEEEFRRWYAWIAQEPDEEKVLQNLRTHNIYSIHLGNVRVNKGEHIAYTGNTGLSSGPHIHLGILINGGYVDPEEFYNLNGIRRGYTAKEMQPLIDWYRNLIRNSN